MRDTFFSLCLFIVRFVSPLHGEDSSTVNRVTIEPITINTEKSSNNNGAN